MTYLGSIADQEPQPNSFGAPQLRLDASVPSTHAQPRLRCTAVKDCAPPTRIRADVRVSRTNATSAEERDDDLHVSMCEPEGQPTLAAVQDANADDTRRQESLSSEPSFT
jgi:hypothetical protein